MPWRQPTCRASLRHFGLPWLLFASVSSPSVRPRAGSRGGAPRTALRVAAETLRLRLRPSSTDPLMSPDIVVVASEEHVPARLRRKGFSSCAYAFTLPSSSNERLPAFGSPVGTSSLRSLEPGPPTRTRTGQVRSPDPVARVPTAWTGTRLARLSQVLASCSNADITCPTRSPRLASWRTVRPDS